jgi:hypothetical protein
MTELRITGDSRLVLTDAEFDALQSMVTKDDRERRGPASPVPLHDARAIAPQAQSQLCW